ncbi:MAG TPA: hypothetical protein DCQ93_06560 [Bacteroidetes bacterium]|nr:hypothetical protein [Bacteroidota bacterium]
MLMLPPKNIRPSANNLRPQSETPYIGVDGTSNSGIDYKPNTYNLVAAVGGVVAGVWIAGKNGYGMLGMAVAVATCAGMAYGLTSIMTSNK